MAIDFPLAPVTDDIFTDANGVKWVCEIGATGTNFDPSNIRWVRQSVASSLMDKITPPVLDNLVSMDAIGNAKDSGITAVNGNIGSTSQTIDIDDPVAGDEYIGQHIVHTADGQDTPGTVNTGHYAQRIDFTSTMQDATKMTRQWGSSINYLISGGANTAYASHNKIVATPANDITTIIGTYSYAQAYNTAGTISSAYGSYNLIYDSDAGIVNQAMASYNFANRLASSTAASTYQIGSSNRIETNTGSGTIQFGIGVRSAIDTNAAAAGSGYTNSYLFYGDYEGSNLPTNSWGIYITDNVPNYFGGDLKVAGTLNETSYKQAANNTTGAINFALGDMVKISPAGNITLTPSNFTSGQVCSMIVECVNFGTYTISYSGTPKFAGGTAPAFTASGTDSLLVTKDSSNVYTYTIIGLDIKVV